MKVGLYARISKGDDQDVETQLLELRDWARRAGVEAEEYVDEISSRDRRPRKEELLRLARTGAVDQIVVVRLDRWGRSLGELVLELEELAQRKVALVSLREGLRFDSAVGRMHAQLLAVFAQFERDLIQERTLAGLQRARSQGKVLGRHPRGCGCGARPAGRPPHDGSVVPVREGNRVVGWRDTNLPRRAGGPASRRAESGPQTPV